MLDRTDHNALFAVRFAPPPMGHNNPPSMLELVAEPVAALSAFLKATPVIQTGDEARAAGALADATARTLADVEAERDRLVRPLNEQVRAINADYHAVHNCDPKRPGTADALLSELKQRMTTYAKREEEARQAKLAALRREMEEAAARARAAAEIAQEAVSEAAMGVETEVGDLTQEAHDTAADFELASRTVTRAERDAKVRIGGGIGRAASLRTRETLTVTDWQAAIAELGLTQGIADAILAAARNYRKAFGELPAGIAATYDRSI